jgi:hypothetical protein
MNASFESRTGIVRHLKSGIEADLTDVATIIINGFTGKARNIKAIRITQGDPPQIAIEFDDDSAIVIKWDQRADAYILQRSKKLVDGAPVVIEHLINGNWRESRDPSTPPTDATQLRRP